MTLYSQSLDISDDNSSDRVTIYNSIITISFSTQLNLKTSVVREQDWIVRNKRDTNKHHHLLYSEQ